MGDGIRVHKFLGTVRGLVKSESGINILDPVWQFLDMMNETVFGFSYFLRTREGCKLTVMVSRFDYHRDNLYQERSSEIDT